MNGFVKITATLMVTVFLVGFDLIQVTEVASGKKEIGILACFISSIAHPLYAWAMVRKKNRTVPHQFTWIISATMAGASLLFYKEAGGQETIYVLVGDFIGFSSIAVLSLFYGVNDKFKAEDWMCLVGAFASIATFAICRSATMALWFALAAEVLALIPTAIKTFKFPDQEDLVAWAFTFLGNVINLFAIKSNIQTEEIYVGVIFVADGIVFITILFGWLKSRKALLVS